MKKFRFWTGEQMLTEGFSINCDGTVWGWVDFRMTSSFVMKGQLLQFTGLLDKNGKEIYEGDVVNYQHSKEAKAYTGEIFWKQDFASFWIKSGNDSGFGLLGQQQVIEIIGNIFLTPELTTP